MFFIMKGFKIFIREDIIEINCYGGIVFVNCVL